MRDIVLANPRQQTEPSGALQFFTVDKRLDKRPALACADAKWPPFDF